MRVRYISVKVMVLIAFLFVGAAFAGNVYLKNIVHRLLEVILMILKKVCLHTEHRRISF